MDKPKRSRQAQQDDAMTCALAADPRLKVIPEFAHFSELPREVQRLVSMATPNVLLNLAQTSRFFARLVKLESTWRDMFKRDFPMDWVFCRGELPFWIRESFVRLHEGGVGWRHWYLHVRQLYVDFAKSFYSRMRAIPLEGLEPDIDFASATFAEMYQFCHRTFAANNPYYNHHTRVTRWTAMFVAHLLAGRHIDPMAEPPLAEMPWFLRYTTVLTNFGGVAPSTLFTPADATAFAQTDWDRIPPVVALQEQHGEAHIQTLLGKMWKLLQDCYHNPCALSAMLHYRLSNETVPWLDVKDRSCLMYMIRESSDVLAQYRVLNEDDDVPYDEMKVFADVFELLDVGRMHHSLQPREFGQLFDLFEADPMSETQDWKVVCIQCGIASGTLQQCGGTCRDKSAVYCGTQCQRQHWINGHRTVCNVK